MNQRQTIVSLRGSGRSEQQPLTDGAVMLQTARVKHEEFAYVSYETVQYQKRPSEQRVHSELSGWTRSIWSHTDVQ